VRSISPKTPKPQNSGNYREKPVDDWGWKDFQNYFDDQHVKILGTVAPALAIKDFGRAKGVIEASYKHWGKQLLRDMIDWTLENRYKHPQWTTISMGLICGKHYWGNYIAEQTQKATKFRLEFKKE